jgi:hypothetical protein
MSIQRAANVSRIRLNVSESFFISIRSLDLDSSERASVIWLISLILNPLWGVAKKNMPEILDSSLRIAGFS